VRATDLQQQFDDLHRVEQAVLDQVRIGSGDLDVQFIEKERVQLCYQAHAVTV
jgi:hypothetical protein